MRFYVNQHKGGKSTLDINKYIHEFDYIDEKGYVHFKGLKGGVKSFYMDDDGNMVDMDSCPEAERLEARKKLTLKYMQSMADILSRDSGFKVNVTVERWD